MAGGAGASGPLVSVIIPVYNQVSLLERCLASLSRQRELAAEVLVVDDASPEPSGPVVARYPFATLLQQERNSGYAEANNRGLRLATGDLLLFLNSDTELPEGALGEMAARLAGEPEVSGLAPRHTGPDGETQRTCYRFPTLLTGLCWDSALHLLRPGHSVFRQFTMADWDHRSTRLVEHAQTSCLMIRREVFDRIGGMDPRLLLFYNDTDYCRRMYGEGLRIRFAPEIEILHHGGSSVQTFENAGERLYGDRYRYFRKWFGRPGGAAVRAAVWSRFLYEALVELAHADLRLARRKVARGLKLLRAMEACS